LDESQRDRVVRDRAFEYINDHRSRLLGTVIPARIARLWGAYHPMDQLRLDALVDRRSLSVSTLGLVQYYLLIPFAIAGAIAVWRRRGPLLVVAAWIPVVTLTAATAFGNTRYRAVAEISLVLLAAVALDAITDRWLARHSAQPVTPPPEHPPGGSS
jgi:hypothetical protein